LERDQSLYSLLEEFDIKFVDDGEIRQHVFRQAFRCFRFEHYPSGAKFGRVFPKLIELIPNLKLSQQRDTKGNNFMHIIYKSFSKECSTYTLDDCVSLKYLGHLPKFVENEPEFTIESLLENLCNQANNEGQLPIEIALKNNNTFGVLHALKYTKAESISEQKEKVILEWLFRQGARDLLDANKEYQKTLGKENKYDVYVRWDDLRDGLSALISDKEKLEQFFVSKAYETGNNDILKNMNITNYDSSKLVDKKDEFKEQAEQ